MISLTMTLYLNPSISDIRNWYGFTTVAAKPSLASSVCECISGDELVVMRGEGGDDGGSGGGGVVVGRGGGVGMW